jgi:hypothetical protein
MLSASKTSGPSGYNLTNSLRFRSSASAYLNRTPTVAGNLQKWTWSGWVKLGAAVGTVGYTIFSGGTAAPATQGNNRIVCWINTSNQLQIDIGGIGPNITTTAVFRDPSAWYHVVFNIDTTQATAGNRSAIYVNGVQQAVTTTVTITQNVSYGINATQIQTIGTFSNALGGYNWDGYMTEVNFVDGQQLTPSSFGSTNATTGVWQPARYLGSYGTNGFYLKFTDIALTSGSNAGLGKDFSGNANYWTTNNISVTAGTTYDAMLDVPTNTSATVGNYCTLNPLPYYGGYTIMSNGNLQFSSGNSNWMRALATFAVSSGKWYWEVIVNNTNAQMHGIVTATTTSYYAGATNWVGYDATGYGYFNDGTKWNNNAGVAYGASFGAGDIIGVAFDADAGTLIFYKNGVSQGTAFTGLTSGPYVPAISNATTSGANVNNINFGQQPFSYTAPSGYKSLNTYNLPDSTIVKGSTVMDATLWTGNGTSQTIVNAGAFRPDLVWIKQRSSTEQNQLMDSVRGSSKVLNSNLTNAESTDATKLTAFNSNGFSVGSELAVNRSGFTYVGWQWQAGQGSSTSNTNGSITSTVSASTTAGFSVVTYTGTGASATVGHGLGVAPKFIIVKKRSAADPWVTYHVSLGVQYYTIINETSASYNNLANYWSATAPSSTVFGLNSYGGNNQSAATYVAYCWAEIAGFSKFGSYTGNGSADGPFVYLGFRPEWILIKGSSIASTWRLWDTARNTYNVSNNTLAPNENTAELTNNSSIAIDILSNGFKLRTSYVDENQSSATYIYMAFAENTFKNALAR